MFQAISFAFYFGEASELNKKRKFKNMLILNSNYAIDLLMMTS